jgi:hypothetical protein
VRRTCDRNNANQLWRVRTTATDRVYMLVSPRKSNLCFDASSLGQGAQPHLWVSEGSRDWLSRLLGVYPAH